MIQESAGVYNSGSIDRMKPRAQYKTHPKMQQIQEDKKRRRELVEAAQQKERQELQGLKQQRKQYLDHNQRMIIDRKEEIYQNKLVKANRVKEEDSKRFQRIQEKKLERLEKYVPGRKQLIQRLRAQYQEQALRKECKKTQLKESNEATNRELLLQLLNPVQVEFNYKNTNEGLCVICLTEKAELMMTACKHLVSCVNCEFILRMNRKCPLCRAPSSYKGIYQEVKGINPVSISRAKR